MTFFPQNAKRFLAATVLATAFSSCSDHGSSHNNASPPENQLAVGNLVLSGGWVRAMPASAKTTAAYFKVHNKSDETDKILSLKSEAAEFVEIHLSLKDENGTSLMRRVPMLEVPAGHHVELKPGSYHVMMINPVASFHEGNTVDMTVTFEKAGDVTWTLPIKSSAVKTDSHADH